MKRAIVTIWSLLAVAIPQAGGATAAEEGTRVDALNAARSGDAAIVTGSATFLDVPVVVGTDPVGDARVPGVGADLVEAVIARPDPFGDSLRFTAYVFDPLEDIGTIPEAIFYMWSMRIGSVSHDILGFRTRQNWNPGSLESVFRLNSGWDPLPGPELEGRIENGVVEFTLPLELVGAGPGTQLLKPCQQSGSACSTWEQDWVVHSGLGWQYGTPNPPNSLDRLVRSPGESPVLYVVPGPSVKLGIAPAGTDPAAIPMTAEASVQGDGSFSGFVSLAGRPPGTYVVLARACYGEGNCGEKTTTITI